MTYSITINEAELFSLERVLDAADSFQNETGDCTKPDSSEVGGTHENRVKGIIERIKTIKAIHTPS